jgi:hypothetical protein
LLTCSERVGNLILHFTSNDQEFVIPLAKTQVEEDIEVSLVTVESENIPLPKAIEQIDLELLQQKVDLLEKSLAEKEENQSKQEKGQGMAKEVQ